MTSFGAPDLISSPDRKRPSRRPAAIFTSPMPSRSLTLTASGWLPCFGSSPLMNTKFSMPSAAAPSTSACSAMRLRSRPVIWTMGSTPALRMITAAATAAIATIARFESVTLTASTKPLRASARRRTTVADAYAGAMGAALAAMVARITAKKEGSSDSPDFIGEMDRLRGELLRLVDADSAAYARVAEAMRLPRKTEEEKRARTDRLQAALVTASEVPLEVAKTARRLLEACERSVASASPMTASDIGVGALLAETALRGAALNVMINLASIKDPAQVKVLSEDLDRTLDGSEEQRKRITDFVESRIAR